MVETRRRKSVAQPAPAGGGGNDATTPSSSGRQPRDASPAADTAGQVVDYAEMYREAARRHREEEDSSFFRRWKGRIHLFYHQQAMIWGWYMLEPWETVLWMSLLLLLTYLVLSACFLNPSSVCRQTLVATRDGVAARAAKLVAFAR